MSYQNRFILFLLVFVSFLVISGSLLAQETEREWVDKSGKFKINATFQKFENQNVFLIRIDGAAIKIPLDNLCLNDQAYVRELERKRDAESEIIPKKPVVVAPKTTPENTKSPMTGQSETTPSNSDPENPLQTTANTITQPDSASAGNPALKVESPDSNFDFLNEDSDDFESAIDINAVNQLPANIREHALVLHKRPNVIDVSKTFFALSQSESLPPVVIQLVKETSQSNNKYYRIQSLKLLAIFDSADSFDLIVESLADQAFNVRMTALDVIQYLKDPRAVDQLVARFPGRDRNKIVTVLTAYGSSVEEKVFPLLKHQNRTVVADAVRLLEKIGTEKSIEHLTPLLDSKVVIRMQARSSIDNIRKRLGQ